MAKAAESHRPARRRRGGATNSIAPRRGRAESRGRKAQIKGAGSRAKPSAALSEPRSSKQAEVITLLRRPEGATVAEVAAATGWQPHTVRGLFSGTLKKKLGLTLASEREERGRTYRIVEGGARKQRRSP